MSAKGKRETMEEENVASFAKKTGYEYKDISILKTALKIGRASCRERV